MSLINVALPYNSIILKCSADYFEWIRSVTRHLIFAWQNAQQCGTVFPAEGLRFQVALSELKFKIRLEKYVNMKLY